MWYLDKLIVTINAYMINLNNVLLYDAHFKSVYVILSTFKKYNTKLAYLISQNLIMEDFMKLADIYYHVL